MIRFMSSVSLRQVIHLRNYSPNTIQSSIAVATRCGLQRGGDQSSREFVRDANQLIRVKRDLETKVISSQLCASTHICSTNQLRWSCSAASNGETAGDEWPEHEFVRMAEETLESISEEISRIGYHRNSTVEDFDIEFSQGVLTISLGSHGTYVLNTQTPNRQIWMSSPTSGPWRYSWEITSKTWISKRDRHSLLKRLTDELSLVFDQPITINVNDLAS